MAQGLELFNANGANVFGTDARVIKFIDFFSVSANGSRTYSQPSNFGTLFAITIGPTLNAPKLTVSGNTVSWSFSGTVTATNIAVGVG